MPPGIHAVSAQHPPGQAVLTTDGGPPTGAVTLQGMQSRIPLLLQRAGDTKHIAADPGHGLILDAQALVGHRAHTRPSGIEGGQ